MKNLPLFPPTSAFNVYFDEVREWGVAKQRGLSNPVVDETVRLVDQWLVKNRRKG
jgi:hypothetical protein